MKYSKLQHFILVLICLISILQIKAESTILCGITNNAHVIPIANIKCIVSDGYSPTFSVFTKSGNIISNINSMTFDYRESSSVNSINEIAIDKEMLIRNNIIEISMLSQGEYISLVDIQGHILWSGISDGSNIRINVTTYPSGYYLLQTGKQTYKIFKK